MVPPRFTWPVPPVREPLSGLTQLFGYHEAAGGNLAA